MNRDLPALRTLKTLNFDNTYARLSQTFHTNAEVETFSFASLIF